MASSLKDLEKMAQALSAEERAKLAESLLASLQVAPLSDIEALWDQEIEVRVAAHERGETQTYAAEDVFAEARRLSR
ncbi:MAG: addiction module antitoxin RelB [Gammaproteobacteria bacterium PRO9]|nr:addiction module antitoxin RelB [Gammaproteobacteria bacterium PRO9]